MRTYKAIIFDLGKVIFDLTFEMSYAYWGSLKGIDSETVRKRFRFDEAYDLFSANKISENEYAQHVSEMIGIELNLLQFETGWNKIYLDAFPGISKTLEKLRTNYRLVGLTNTNVTHAKVWPLRYENELQHFEKVFSSHEIGIVKPDKKAFAIVLDYLSLSPEDVIFLDDGIENVRGAEAVGIKSILVSSSSQMVSDLRSEGILI